MRVINSASVLASRRGEKLVVLWYACAELGCAFTDLFLPVKRDDLEIIDITSLKDPRKIYYQMSASQRFGNDDILAARGDGTLDEAFFKSLKGRVYISTWEHFYPSHDYGLYRPTADIQEKIDSFTENYSPRCIGVHIRRTDNTVSMGKSTTDQFIALMDRELLEHPESRFFLATDDLKEEELLRARFPGKIISNQAKVLDRDGIEGMKDAVVDLFCLSAADGLIGSYWSSFTDIAADMRGIEKLIAGED